jgi:hypothetical protein
LVVHDGTNRHQEQYLQDHRRSTTQASTQRTL